MLRKCSGYAKARQFRRLRQGVAVLKGYLRRVVADLEAAVFVPGGAAWPRSEK